MQHFFIGYGLGSFGRIDVRYLPYTYLDPETNEPINTIRRNDERFYYISDHLGSVRAIVDSSGTTVFAQDTYPYGDIYRTYTLGGYSDQKYDFTGKERDIETGLHYFGARYYDSDLGRWLQVDPLADKYPGWSPYNYCVNNPVRMIDPDGREVDDKEVKDNEAYKQYKNSKLGKKRLAQFQNGGKYQKIKLKFSQGSKMNSEGGPVMGTETPVKVNGRIVQINISLNFSSDEQTPKNEVIENAEVVAHEVDHADFDLTVQNNGLVNEEIKNSIYATNVGGETGISAFQYVNARVGMMQEIAQKNGMLLSKADAFQNVKKFYGFSIEFYNYTKSVNIFKEKK